MKRGKIILTVAMLLFISIIFLATTTIAVGTQLFCLKEGQIIKFSECNSDIEDKTCETTTCQICVNEIRNRIYCPVNINECNQQCIPFEESSQENPPQITLISPQLNQIIQTPQQIDFLFRVARSYDIKDCDLILDSTSILVTSRIQSGNNKITQFVQSGEHSWKIQCTTRSNVQINSEIMALTVQSNQNNGPSQPITLISPEDNKTTTQNQDMMFTFKIAKDLITEQLECSLIINNNFTSIINTTSDTNTLYHNLEIGQYIWRIECKNEEEIFLSQTRTLTIALQPNQDNIQSSSSSAGVGGSSGSSSSGGGAIIQSKKQNKSKNLSSINNTDMAQLVSLNSNITNNSEIIKQIETAMITGATIGTLEKYKLLAIVFIIIIFISVIFFFIKRK